ncbi:MAG: Membrane protein, partial [uncultured bacterium]
MNLAVALAIGLMVGIERGWKAREVEDHGRAAGLRTFGLSGLMGGVCGVLSGPLGAQIVSIGFLAFSAAFGAFAWLEAKAKRDLSATTLVAGMLTFLLGAMATVGDVTVAIAAAVSMTVLLALRTQLHSWLAAITWQEIRAGLILGVMSFLLLPLLPNRAIDPWGAVNLHEVWLLAIMMALISFTGYVAVRIFGDKVGIIITAAAGGLASST